MILSRHCHLLERKLQGYLTVKDASSLWNMDERKLTALCRDKRIPGARKDGKLWYIPSDARRPLDRRTKEAKEKEASETASAVKALDDLYYTPVDASARVVKEFRKKYDREPLEVAFTPYRICPLGAHVDHNLGKITGFTIDKGIHIAYGFKQNGIVEIASLQFPKRAQWHVLSTPSKPQGDWADHLRGATIALGNRYSLRFGLCALIDGELPIGGLSSSASVIITFLSALAKLNDIKLSSSELIEISQEAENNYVGVSCGKLDQSCEVFCRKDRMLYLDTKDESYELISAPSTMKPYVFMILFSGVERSLAGSKYNMRVDELRSAAYALKAFAGLSYGKFKETNMREVPREVFEEYRDKLPLNWRKRAEHWFTELDRVEAGAEAWRRGDIEEYGRLSFESGRSSIENWETGSPELIRLYELLASTPGVYGGRFSGAGFKGCCMALVNPDAVDSINTRITEGYLAAFPSLAGRFSIHVCHSADGVML